MKIIPFLAALAAFIRPANAAPGDLDLTFGGTGIVTTDFGNGGSGRDVAIQSDGQIVVVGEAYVGSSYDMALVRYNANGSLDTTFNGSGKVTTAFGSGSDNGNSLVIQSNGKIVVAGTAWNGLKYDFALGRYNANGTLDTSFNGTGKVTTTFGNIEDVGSSILAQSDGKLMVAGYSRSGDGSSYDIALARYNPNGTLDTTFHGNGKVTTAIGSSSGAAGHTSVTIQSDEKIVVGGSSRNATGNDDFAVMRYNIDGSLDTTFNGTGIATTDFNGGFDFGQSITVMNDGKILLAGYSTIGGNFDIALVRYNADGTLDLDFNGTGKVTTDFGLNVVGASVAVQNSGEIVVVGSSNNSIGTDSDFAVARYNANGSLDTNFNGTGKVTTSLGTNYDSGFSVALQSNGKIVVAGASVNGTRSIFAVVRYEGDTSVPEPSTCMLIGLVIPALLGLLRRR